MRAVTVTLRIDDLLVGIGADSTETAALIRARFAPVVDDTQPDVAVSFDVLLGDRSDRGVRSVPQLRRGRSVVARSRTAGDVIDALDSILGGVRAHRATPDRVWAFPRPFVRNEQVVLVDARAPLLVNDPVLARLGIAEIPTWTLAVTRLDGGSRAVVDVPAALTGTPAGGRFELVGLVTVGETTDPVGAGAVLARYGARHTSPTWFRTLGALLDHDRFVVTTDRVTARHAIERLLTDSV